MIKKVEFSISLSGEFCATSDNEEDIKREIISYFIKDKSSVDALYVDEIVILNEEEDGK